MPYKEFVFHKYTMTVPLYSLPFLFLYSGKYRIWISAIPGVSMVIYKTRGKADTGILKDEQMEVI